jgi:hypothetical protein
MLLRAMGIVVEKLSAILCSSSDASKQIGTKP